jgi:hypothetical protein
LEKGLGSAALMTLLQEQQPQAPKQDVVAEKPIVPYDWKTIFASEADDAKAAATRYAAGGMVDDMVEVNNELLRFLRG